MEQEVDGSGSCIGFYVQGGAPWNFVPRSGYLSIVCALLVAEHATCDINLIPLVIMLRNTRSKRATSWAVPGSNGSQSSDNDKATDCSTSNKPAFTVPVKNRSMAYESDSSTETDTSSKVYKPTTMQLTFEPQVLSEEEAKLVLDAKIKLSGEQAE